MKKIGILFGQEQSFPPALVERVMGLRGGRLPWPLRWRDGLGIVPGATVIPHYDAWPEALSALFVPHYLGSALSTPSLRSSPWDVLIGCALIAFLAGVRLRRRRPSSAPCEVEREPSRR